MDNNSNNNNNIEHIKHIEHIENVDHIEQINTLIDKIDDMNESIIEMKNSINKLTELVNLLTITINQNNNTIDSLNHLSSNNLVSNVINESIVLYSIKDEPFIKKLNLKEDKLIIRTCRSNSLSKRSLVNRISNNNKNIIVYKQYNVSNPHDISIYTINKLITSNELDVNNYYGHLIINKKDLQKVLNAYDNIINTFKPNVISLLINEHKPNNNKNAIKPMKSIKSMDSIKPNIKTE
ncbi:hypothetical protein BCR32DRAFT_242043 [Anaeromyces robustus]|uniref:Uncharacterized protein n=1 Tax=Anaeromyces robustus TaxID=1754192 RepID=A0A1Y1XHC2_9FUNG|nr:hypothetical protein BCR32DRAFT_242043 [Anaeromyces robustus]|eukprot:ORX85140.1 hypothetical protein BCR32DRAFT_242043 [Anaeromyces robustus]